MSFKRDSSKNALTKFIQTVGHCKKFCFLSGPTKTSNIFECHDTGHIVIKELYTVHAIIAVIPGFIEEHSRQV